jgi:hypothetical protein
MKINEMVQCVHKHEEKAKLPCHSACIFHVYTGWPLTDFDGNLADN